MISLSTAAIRAGVAFVIFSAVVEVGVLGLFCA